MSTKLNRDAKEFVPPQVKSLRPDAPEFVPNTSPPSLASITDDLIHLISLSSVKGVRVGDIPFKFQTAFNRHLDMSFVEAADLSVWIHQLCLDPNSGIQIVEPGTDFPSCSSINEAMKFAGFNVVVESATDDIVPPSTSDIVIGDLDKAIVRCVIYENFVDDLILFKESIIDVVGNFGTRCEGPSTAGLALSLFAAEWDRFHTVRHLFSDLKNLRERFGAVKLMPFLQAIPELEVVGTHPEVRVRIRPGHFWDNSRVIPSPRNNMNRLFSTPASTPPMTPTISLNSELFGKTTTPPASPEAQTRVILEQMLSQTQSQILDILKTVPSDPIEAANAISKINELQVLVNAIKAALAVLPTSNPPTPKTSRTTNSSMNRTTLSIDSLLHSGEKKQPRQLLSLDSMLDLPPIDETAPIISPPSSPLTAAACAGDNVGNLLSDLSRILFAQVIQQQQGVVSNSAVEETNAALEKTLNEIVSAASSPPSSPMNSSGNILETSSLIGQGQLIIPKSLPTSPIVALHPMNMKEATGHSTPLLGGSLNSSRELLSLSSALGISDDAPTTAATTPNDTTMDTLLRGLMNHAMSPPGLECAAVAPRFAPRKVFVNTSVVTNCDKDIVGKNKMLAVLKVMIETQMIGDANVPRELAGLSCKQAPPRVNRRTVAELAKQEMQIDPEILYGL